MNCHKCGHKMAERTIRPANRDEVVTLYSCRNAQCEYDEEQMEHRRWWYKRWR